MVAGQQQRLYPLLSLARAKVGAPFTHHQESVRGVQVAARRGVRFSSGLHVES